MKVFRLHFIVSGAAMALVAVALATAAPRARAQAVPASAAGPSAGEPPVVLTPFTVTSERDRGYLAGSTLAGTRMNTELWDTPVAISVMTQQFLEDTGVTDVREALEYALNASVDFAEFNSNTMTAEDFSQIEIRGFRGAKVGRNYFGWQLSSPTYNIERLDFSRGPNSVLYGQGSPGGIINTTTKRAQIGRNVGRAAVTIGSFNDHRVELDYGRTLAKGKFAARMNLMFQDRDGYREFEEFTRKGGALAMTWRPFKNTEIRFDGEAGDVDQVVAPPWGAHEIFRGWERAGSQPSATLVPAAGRPAGSNFVAPAAAPGLGVVGRPNNLVWDPFSGFGPMPMKLMRTTFSGGQGAAFQQVVLDQSIIPRSASITGPAFTGDFAYYNWGLFVEQRVGENLFFEVAFNRQENTRFTDRPMPFGAVGLTIDANQWRPGNYDRVSGFVTEWVPNPMFGKYYVESRANHSLAVQDFRVDDYRATASYRLDLTKRNKWLGRHDLAGLATRTDRFNWNDSFLRVNLTPQLMRAGAAGTTYSDSLLDIDNRINRRAYIDFSNPDPRWHGMYDYRKFPLVGLPEQNYVTEGWLRGSDAGRDTLTRTDTQMAVLQSRWLDGRIVTTYGIRKDKLRTFRDEDYRRDANGNILRNAEGGAMLATTATSDPSSGWTRRTRGDAVDFAEGPTKTYGIVAHPLRWLALFYNKSDSFEPRAGVDVYGRAIGNRKGIGEDYGVRLRLGDRVFVNITRWSIDDTGQGSTGLSGNWWTYINAIHHLVAGAGPEDALPTRDPITSAIVDSQDLVGEGTEYEIVANPTDNWRLSFGASQNRQVTSNKYPITGGFMEQNRATWMANGNLYTTGDIALLRPGEDGHITVTELIEAADATLATARAEEGKTRRQLREWNGSFFTSYKLNRGAKWLHGLTIGGGGQYQGRNPIGYNAAANDALIYGNDFFLLNGMMAYQTKIFGRSTKFQLNVNNILEEKDMIEQEGVINATTGVRTVYRYRLQKPRTWTLRMAVDF